MIVLGVLALGVDLLVNLIERPQGMGKPMTVFCWESVKPTGVSIPGADADVLPVFNPCCGAGATAERLNGDMCAQYET